jgi:hypothetical protein
VISTELLTATQFFEEARREARSYRQPLVEDALSKAVIEIELNPALAQSRLLTRILVAVARREGGFRRSDLTLLSVKALGMVDSLLEGHASGKRSQDACTRAADRVEVAQRIADAGDNG